MSLLSLVHRRLIIVTGKGGVGKTTVAAALGLAFARTGKRVLLAEIVPSADTPSALREAVGGSAPTEHPTLLSERLWVSLLTPTMGHRRFLQDTLPIRVLADAAMRSQGLRKFLSAAPGFSDMGVMYSMLDLMRRKAPDGGPLFEVCVVDSPATGHALALAQIPEFLMRVIPGGPIHRAAAEGVKMLTDPAVSGCVVVTLPETLPVTEAMDLERGLARHGLTVSAMVVNRVPRDPFTPAERAAVSGLLRGEPATVFGERELQRLERSEAALQLLREQHPLHTVVLHEVEGEHSQITRQLAAAL